MMGIDQYCKDVSAAYWAEQDELISGIHPTQIIERIKAWLNENCVSYQNISFLQYINPHSVKVSLDDEYYGTFDYINNQMISLA